MESSGPRVGDSCRVGEGCRCDEEGLGFGGAGKREYLDFFASILPKSWGKRKNQKKKLTVQKGQSMDPRERVVRVEGGNGNGNGNGRARVWGSRGIWGIWRCTLKDMSIYVVRVMTLGLSCYSISTLTLLLNKKKKEYLS